MLCLLWLLLFLHFDFSHNLKAATSSSRDSTGHYEEPISSTENNYVMEPRENQISQEVNKNVSDCVGNPQESEYEVGDASWEPTMFCRYQSWGAPSPRQNTYLSFHFCPWQIGWTSSGCSPFTIPAVKMQTSSGTSVTDSCIELLIFFPWFPFTTSIQESPLKAVACRSQTRSTVLNLLF